MTRPFSQSRFWLIFFIVLFIAVWVLRPILLPFAAGIAIAYALDPMVEFLVRNRIPRWISSIVVLITFAMTIILLLSLIAPVLQDQIEAIIVAAPDYVSKLRSHTLPWAEKMLEHFAPNLAPQLNTAATESAASLASILGNGLKQVISGGLAFFDLIAIAVITPIIAYYILRDWPILKTTLDNYIPRRYYNVIRQEINTIDDTLSGFLRGQALVCLALSFYYAIGLTAAGLQYGLSIGILAGALSFMPYVGSTFAWIFSLTLALVHFGEWTPVLIVTAVLVIGQLLEGYVLVPRLIGNRIGLHPVWIFFSLLAGAKLLGFLGLLIAVPTAAIVGVLVRFSARQYRNSIVYKDIL